MKSFLSHINPYESFLSESTWFDIIMKAYSSIFVNVHFHQSSCIFTPLIYIRSLNVKMMAPELPLASRVSLSSWVCFTITDKIVGYYWLWNEDICIGWFAFDHHKLKLILIWNGIRLYCDVGCGFILLFIQLISFVICPYIRHQTLPAQ